MIASIAAANRNMKVMVSIVGGSGAAQGRLAQRSLDRGIKSHERILDAAEVAERLNVPGLVGAGVDAVGLLRG